MHFLFLDISQTFSFSCSTWNDLFCSCMKDVSIWLQMFNFVFLPLKHMALNNWETIAETRSYSFWWSSHCRVCLSSLMIWNGTMTRDKTWPNGGVVQRSSIRKPTISKGTHPNKIIRNLFCLFWLCSYTILMWLMERSLRWSKHYWQRHWKTSRNIAVRVFQAQFSRFKTLTSPWKEHRNLLLYILSSVVRGTLAHLREWMRRRSVVWPISEVAQGEWRW